MNKCKLCKKDANQTGSHIVPHFLLKRIENIDGKTGRGYELGFAINKHTIQSHFGQSISPDFLETVYGMLTDEEIKQNKHPFVIDYIFCIGCENRFGQIEHEYSKTVNKTNTQIYNSGIKAELGVLFWASVIWRMSVFNRSGIQLTKNQEETLRRILDRCLSESISQVDIEAMRKSKDLNRISYKLLRCCDPSYNKILSWYSKFRNPYLIVIEGYILLFSFNGRFEECVQKEFFGLNEAIKNTPVNNKNSSEQIQPIDSEKLTFLNNELLNPALVSYVDNLFEDLDDVYVAFGVGNSMPNDTKQAIWKEINSEEKKLGRKHTREEKNNSIIKILHPIINQTSQPD